jgi:hypothetical protein
MEAIMERKGNLNRRDFIQVTGLGAAVLMTDTVRVWSYRGESLQGDPASLQISLPQPGTRGFGHDAQLSRLLN